MIDPSLQILIRLGWTGPWSHLLCGHGLRANAPLLPQGDRAFADHTSTAACCHIPQRDHRSLGTAAQPGGL